MAAVGYHTVEMNAMVHIKITSLEKLRQLLRQASDKDCLCKTLETGESAKVLVSQSTPVCISFSRKKIFVTFTYTWYNRFGVKQM